MKAIELLGQFIEENKHVFSANSWLNGDDINVYVRKGLHFINNGRYTMLDIANIQVYNTGKGQFTKFLCQAEEINPWDGVYVQSLLNDRLRLFLLRQGYHDANTIPPSVYKIKEKS